MSNKKIIKTIYGIDLQQTVHAKDVRDAIVECFVQAHSEAYEKFREFGRDNLKLSNAEFSNYKKISATQLIRNYFDKVGGDFDNPNKQDILKVMKELKGYASNFRSPKIIQKHFNEIKKIVDKLP